MSVTVRNEVSYEIKLVVREDQVRAVLAALNSAASDLYRYGPVFAVSEKAIADACNLLYKEVFSPLSDAAKVCL